MSDYVELNRANWDSRVPHHVQGYGLDAFADPSHLSDVVRFDLELLGDVTGLDVVHLQCHIGTDTVSLARRGPRRVVGVDFSALALAAACELSAAAATPVDFVECELYDTLGVLEPASFDLVYTGIGALCWIPDIRGWAEVVSGLLRPGGRLFLREGHPVLWALDDPRPDGLLALRYPYFESAGVHFVEEHSYVEHDEPLAAPESVSFNHGLGEIITALMDAGLHLSGLVEHRSVPWNPLGDAMVEVGAGEWALKEGPERLPLTYTLPAVKGD